MTETLAAKTPPVAPKTQEPTVPQYEFHPLTERFPLLEGKEFDELTSDVHRYGVREPIVLFEGKILDGRNRYRAAKAAKIPLVDANFKRLPSHEEARAFVISVNIMRRHLTAEQKRELIAELLKLHPGLSDRAIAAKANVSHHTVADVRQATGQIAQLDTREGRDGKKRKATSNKRDITPKRMFKELEGFKERWELLNDWQRRAFVKAFKDELAELLEEAENEAAASSPSP